LIGLANCPLLAVDDQPDAKVEGLSYQLVYPSIESLDRPQPFGYKPASEAQKQRAKEAVAATPKGPTPIDVARSFIERYYDKEPEVISQWPAPDAWNPLLVEFFTATTHRANNDMIPWCAAFTNWCLERCGRTGSRSTSSQSFFSKEFKTTNYPKPGDLAIFTCYDKQSGKSLGLGHVGFFKEKLSSNKITVVGGNQSGGGHYSIISEVPFTTTERGVRRHFGNSYVSCMMRLNNYISII
jgi:uncharacterized protein (TIGR02594 family)